jgi:teichuronic acid biosynthesis glycosyltransferase TuaG
VKYKDNLVSIITPADNCEATISETIESVLAQTWSSWELMVINDCSSDNTKAIVENYTNKDSRIKLINLDDNSGSAVARNTGIERAEGRFIALLDSDDMWKPRKLELQLKFMIKNGYGFSFTEYEIFRNSSDTVRKVFSVPKSIRYKEYLKNTTIGCLTVIVDRKQIPDFHMERGYLEDILTWMYYLRKGVVAYGLRKNLASYRVVANSKSSNKIKNAIRYYNCLRVQPNIGTMRRVYSEVCYVINAVIKRVFSQTINVIQ